MIANRNSLKELAARSGYSLASVSRALDPARCHLVRPATREKIQRCVEEMSFSINLSARRLKRNRTEVITSVAFVNQFKNKTFSNEFVSRSIQTDDIQGLSSSAKRCHYDMKLEYIYPGMDYALVAEDIIDRNRTDGIIFVAYYGIDFHRKLMSSGLPHIYMSRYIDVNRQEMPLVGLRREPGFRAALEHLLRQGRRRFAWIGVPISTQLRINREIVADLLLEYGCYDEKLFFSVDNYYQLRELFRNYHPQQFDAIFCSNDVMADWVVRELRFNGFRIPDDLTVVGYDNDPAYHGENSLEISSIGTPRHLMCERAVELLLEMIDNGPDPARRAVFDTSFFPRET